jgi:hypothetical protein
VLSDKKVTPLLVLEQAVEAKTAKTMTAVDAHAAGVKHAKVFKSNAPSIPHREAFTTHDANGVVPSAQG